MKFFHCSSVAEDRAALKSAGLSMLMFDGSVDIFGRESGLADYWILGRCGGVVSCKVCGFWKRGTWAMLRFVG